MRLTEAVSCQPLYDHLAEIQVTDPSYDNNNTLPGLQNIFLARLQNGNRRTDTVNLKYDLRQLFAGERNRTLRHSLFGTVKGEERKASKIHVSFQRLAGPGHPGCREERKASKIHVSFPYGDPSKMRVWGWTGAADQRDSSLNKIRDHLSGLDSSLTWREFDSPRDTKQRHTSMLEFLADLLEVSS